MPESEVSIRSGGQVSWKDPLVFSFPVIIAALPHFLLDYYWLSIVTLVLGGTFVLALALVFSIGGFNSREWVEGNRLQFPIIIFCLFIGEVVWFSSLYLLIQSHNPEAFNVTLDSVGSMYFSLATITTTGFGDINAASSGAKVAVSIEMVCSILTVVVFISTAASKAFAKDEH